MGAHWDQASEDSEEEELTNPYDYNLDVDAGQHVSSENPKAQLPHLRSPPATTIEGMRATTLVVDINLIASKLLHLQSRGVIMYTVKNEN